MIFKNLRLRKGERKSMKIYSDDPNLPYKTTGRTPTSPQQPSYTMPFQDNVVAYTDHGGSLSGDGNVEVVSQRLTKTYIGGGTGNVWKCEGKLDKLRMWAYNGGAGGEGWSTIEYQWGFTLSQDVANWRAKVYFTIPDAWGFSASGGNSLTVWVKLYNSGGQLVASDERYAIQNLDSALSLGKMCIFNNMSIVSTLGAGTYTVKLGFRCHAGGVSTILKVGYAVPDWFTYKEGLPMGLEYFGYDCTAASGGETQRYEYYNTNDDTYLEVFDFVVPAQTFTAISSHTASSFRVKLYKYGNPTGDLTISLRATDGNGHPTGSDLSSTTMPASILTTNTNGAWYTVWPTPEYTLSAGVKYAVVVKLAGGNNNNEVRWRTDASSPTYSGGNEEESYNGGSTWQTHTEWDNMFEIWGVNP